MATQGKTHSILIALHSLVGIVVLVCLSISLSIYWAESDSTAYIYDGTNTLSCDDTDIKLRAYISSLNLKANIVCDNNFVTSIDETQDFECGITDDSGIYCDDLTVAQNSIKASLSFVIFSIICSVVLQFKFYDMEFFGYGTIILIILLDLTSFVTSSLTASFFRKYVDEQTDFKNKNINDSGYDLFINLKWEFYDGWILVICTAVMNVIMSLLAIKISFDKWENDQKEHEYVDRFARSLSRTLSNISTQQSYSLDGLTRSHTLDIPLTPHNLQSHEIL